MAGIADYEAWKAKRQQANVGAATYVLNASDQSPQDAARDLSVASEFARTTGNPVPPAPLVREYRNEFERKIAEAKNQTILSSAPRLTEWLRNPENATVARDDLENLSWFEGFQRGTAATIGRADQRVRQVGNQFMFEQTAGRAEDRKRTFGQIVETEFQGRATDMQGNPLATWDGSEYLAAMGRWIDAKYAGMIGTDDNAAALEYAAGVAKNLANMQALPKSAIAQRFEKQAMVKGASGGEALRNFGTAILKEPLGAFSWMWETAGESAPQLLAALGTTMATRNPMAGASVGGFGSYATERYVSPAEFFKENGIDLAKPDDVRRAMGDYGLMRDAANRGVIRGLVIGAFDMLSMGVAGRSLAKNPMVEVVAQGLSQAVLGSAGEYVARLAAGQEIDWNEILAEGLGQMATGPIDAGIAGRKFMSQRDEAGKAVERKAMFEALSGQSQASALRARLPDKFRQFVEQATANGPVESVYVPAQQFATYFQSLNIDPFAMADEMDGVTRDDLEIALAGGTDIRIPTATYAAKIAGTEHDAFMMENMRFDPNHMTAFEAAEFNTKAADALQEAWEVSERQRQDAAMSQSFEDEIYATMVSRLRVAGRSTEVATTEAALWPAFYKTMAARSNMSVDEFMARYPLPDVQGAIPEGLKLKDVDALTRTLAELRRSRKPATDRRQSLLEFIAERGGIDDRGGELRAMDAEVVDRGRGKKKLVLARKPDGGDGQLGLLASDKASKKFGPDDVAMAAIEAGFLDGDPVADAWRAAVRDGSQVPDIVPALWSAISRELAGDRAFSVNDPIDKQVEKNNARDEQLAYLDKIGVSLDDDDATIRAALDRANSENAVTYDQARRGSISVPAGGVADGQSVIRLFENANLSTLIHESGHYFLAVMQDMATRGETVAASDMAAVKDWWRANAAAVAKDATGATVTEADVLTVLDNGTTGDAAKDAAVDVGFQEQWARGFETYVMEGKAPSAGLRGAFEKMRSWLVSVYRRLAGLNVKISDDLRAVFDRMLATDDEIAKAQQEVGGTENLFATAEQMGLSQEEFARFVKLRQQAEDDAKARLLAETMAPIRREAEREFKVERAKVAAEVERDVNAYPMYRAIEWMGNRRWLGEGQPEAMPDFRLSKDILVERYGDGVLSTLPRGKQTVYAVEGGIDPDDAAELFGFGSGDEMIRAMERAPKRGDAIRAETDRIMRERHGDALNDGSVESKALDVVHNDRRGEWIAAELNAIVDVAQTGARMTLKEARVVAAQTVRRMRVRDALASNRFLAAERKAAAEAAQLGAMLARDSLWLQAAQRRVEKTARRATKGDASVDQVNAAIDRRNPTAERRNETAARLIDAKRRQLLNHAMYAESVKISEEVEKGERFARKLGKASTRERIAGAGRRENAEVDYLAAIDEVLERYDFSRATAADERRRGALNDFVAKMQEQGREGELAIPDDVLRMSARAPYKTIPVEEFRGVIATLRNIEHVASRWDKVIDERNKRTREEAVASIVAAFDANMPKRPPGRVATAGEAARTAGRQFLDLFLNASTLLREIDGFKDMGAAYSAIKAPIDQAQSRLIVRKEKAATDLESLYSVYSDKERRAMLNREHVPEVGRAFSKWDIISVALNLGNEGNKARLMNAGAYSLTEGQIAALLAKLDARDAAFVQSVWDYLDTFRADMAALERRMTGTEPAWVDARPVTIAGKTLKGGYYPLKYDPRLSASARDNQQQGIAEALMAGKYSKAQTRQGHLKARGQNNGQAVLLDMSVLHRHVTDAIYDLELREPVSNAWGILRHADTRNAFVQAGRSADFDALETWIKDVAEGELHGADRISQLSRSVKSNFTLAKLAFNMTTVLLQVTGMAQASVVVGKKNFMRGLQASLRSGAGEEVAVKSSFMSTRRTTFNKDIYDYFNDAKQGPAQTRMAEAKAELGRYGFWLMTKTQWHIVDVPTWLAGYQQGLKKFGGDETQAVAHADAIVKRSQASGIFSDRSAVERGSISMNQRQSDVVRMFTALGSYMFAKANVAYERTISARNVIQDEGFSLKSAHEVMEYTVDMALLFTLEAVLMGMIKGKLPSEDDDEEKDGWAKFLAKETGLAMMGTIPFVRDGASALKGFDGGGAYGGVIGDIFKGAYGAGQLALVPFSDQEAKKGALKNAINGVGTLTGLPSAQFNRFVDAAWRRSEGEDVPMIDWIVGKTGKGK